MIAFSRLLLPLSLLLAVLTMAPASNAETLRTIDSARIRLTDLLEVQSQEFQDVDLGPAPPPGSSRLLAREDVLRELSAQGVDIRQLKLPALVRLQSAARRFSATEIETWVTPRVSQLLPRGVSLVTLKVTRAILASPRLQIGQIQIPKLARRAGATTVTAMVEFLHDGESALRLPVTLSLELTEAAARPAIDKGARVDLVIARGSARISATGIALEAAEIGEIASFKVSTTQKILRARVESPTRALVVTP